MAVIISNRRAAARSRRRELVNQGLLVKTPPPRRAFPSRRRLREREREKDPLPQPRRRWYRGDADPDAGHHSGCEARFPATAWLKSFPKVLVELPAPDSRRCRDGPLGSAMVACHERASSLAW